MAITSNISVSILEKLTVTVSQTRMKGGVVDWERTNEVPRFNRMYFFVEGQGSIKLNDSVHFPQKNQLYILPAGTKQTFRTSSEQPYTRYYCDFYATIGEWPLLQHATTAFIADVKDPDDVRRTFDELINHFTHQSATSSLRSNAALMRLIAICMEDGQYGDFLQTLLISPEQHKLRHALSYIQSNLSKPITVEELAELIHFHPNYFIAFFKKHMGITPMLHVQRMRLEQAKYLLSSTDQHISDIANTLGMELAYFSKQFKRMTGLSPSAYRNSSR